MTRGVYGMPEFEEGRRVSASKLRKLAELAARGNSEVDGYIDELGVYASTYPPIEIWYFELAEELVQWATTPTMVYRRFIDPEGNSGNGELVTTCEAQYQFPVIDMKKIGYFGVAGATGSAHMVQTKNGPIGIIDDLRCPADCVCGDESEATACGE